MATLARRMERRAPSGQVQDGGGRASFNRPMAILVVVAAALLLVVPPLIGSLAIFDSGWPGLLDASGLKAFAGLVLSALGWLRWMTWVVAVIAVVRA
ncbi:MAG: hypothetical protein ACHQ0J_11090 [Candidatus Dormibacterales bacterium]